MERNIGILTFAKVYYAAHMETIIFKPGPARAQIAQSHPNVSALLRQGVEEMIFGQARRLGPGQGEHLCGMFRAHARPRHVQGLFEAICQKNLMTPANLFRSHGRGQHEWVRSNFRGLISFETCEAVLAEACARLAYADMIKPQ